MKDTCEKRKYLAVFLLIFLLAGCNRSELRTEVRRTVRLDPRNPVTLTIWHPYQQRMRVIMDELINEFNSTVGAERGIIIRDSYVARNAEISSALMSAADGVPGAPGLPDISVVYPGVAMIMEDKGLLVDLSAYFSAEELSQYVPAFVEEGTLGRTRGSRRALYIMPVAKSTEVLFVNATMFNRFAADVDGITLSALATFEGLQETAKKYYEWSGGKSFVYYKDLFNYSLAGFNQLGGSLLAETPMRFNVSSEIFRRVWDGYFPGAVKGGLAIFDGYGSQLMATGETVAILDTTASIAFLSNTVTFADNTREEYELAILPYPVFQGGEKAAIQQGGGMCVFKSDARREYAAAVFLKWFTSPEQNIRFTLGIGYMPVATQAFNEFLQKQTENIADENIRKLINVKVTMQQQYRFIYPSPVHNIDEETRFAYERAMRTAAENARQDYLGGTAFETVSAQALERFITGMR